MTEPFDKNGDECHRLKNDTDSDVDATPHFKTQKGDLP